MLVIWGGEGPFQSPGTRPGPDAAHVHAVVGNARFRLPRGVWTRTLIGCLDVVSDCFLGLCDAACLCIEFAVPVSAAAVERSEGATWGHSRGGLRVKIKNGPARAADWRNWRVQGGDIGARVDL